MKTAEEWFLSGPGQQRMNDSEMIGFIERILTEAQREIDEQKKERNRWRTRALNAEEEIKEREAAE